MKVIFLDHDGVICLQNNWGSRSKKQQKWGGRKPFMSLKDIPIEYRFDNFDKKAIKVLNQILEETEAEIVVSSDWRLHSTINELGDYYESQGIIKKPIDVTEVFNFTKWLEEKRIPEDFPWYRPHSLEQERHFEIKEWLNSNPQVTHWVAVDDLNMGIHIEASRYGAHDRDWGLENFVWTPRDWEGIKQTGKKEKIISFFKMKLSI
jgi:hypothetical protein